MRISGGVFGGRKIKTARGLATRPTTDKVRQAIFNILMNEIEGAEVLDLFAGSGALGIEAVSRGAETAVFVESEPVPAAVIRANLESLELGCELLETDYVGACQYLSEHNRSFNLIFADPPYDRITPTEVADLIVQYNLLKPRGLFIIEHKLGLSVISDEMILLKKRKFRQTEVSFLKRKEVQL